MQRHVRALLTGLAAAAVLATAIGTATAARLRLAEERITVVWSAIEVLNSITSNTVRCPLTLEGSFHSRTITKTRGLLVGYLTRGALNHICTGGRATIMTETLPWHITYNSFHGVLPIITDVGINLMRVGIVIEIPEVNTCKFVTSVESPARAILNIGVGGRIEGMRADETSRIPLSNGPGGFLCGLGTGSFRGVGSVVALGSGASVSIILI